PDGRGGTIQSLPRFVDITSNEPTAARGRRRKTPKHFKQLTCQHQPRTSHTAAAANEVQRGWHVHRYNPNRATTIATHIHCQHPARRLTVHRHYTPLTANTHCHRGRRGRLRTTRKHTKANFRQCRHNFWRH